MYEKLLAQAVLPAPVQVLGLAMRPYSVGHELWLIRQDNPLATFSAGRGTVTAAHLFEAALICEHTQEQNLRLNSSLYELYKIKRWSKRAAVKFNAFTELKKFQAYRDAGSLELPCQLPAQSSDSGPSRFLGAPFLLRLHLFLTTQCRMNDSEAWDSPFGFAKIRHAAWLEENRRLEIKNEQDVKVDEARAQWEREHPESGLEIISNEGEESCPA